MEAESIFLLCPHDDLLLQFDLGMEVLGRVVVAQKFEGIEKLREEPGMCGSTRRDKD